jgi:hypothetical protein
MREVVDGNGFFLAAPGSGGGGGESEEETARKDTEQESNTAADPIRVVPRGKYIPSPPPLLPLRVSLFLALAHKPVFCTNSVRNLYAITIPLLLLPLLCKRAIAGARKEQAAATTAAESHHQKLEQRRT